MTHRIVAIAPKDIDPSKVKVVADQAEITDTYALYLDDESHSFDGSADRIAFPSNESEIALLMKNANDSVSSETARARR